MKNRIYLLLFLVFNSLFGQTTTNYTPIPASEIISNPERGLYKPFDTFSNNYLPLNQTQLSNFRINNNISLIYRGFYLNDFKNAPISQTYLNLIQADFTILRNSGLKAIIRFAYTNNENDVQKDASKATILSHILQLQPILIANADVILTVQAGFIGVYGEWYYTSQADFGGFGFNGTPLTTQNYLNRKEITDALLNALPSNRMIQVRTPYFKREMYSMTPISNAQAFNESSIARLGHHNDCFLASETDFGTYIDIPSEYPYLAQETNFLPMGGETCVLNSPRTDCATSIQEMELFHWSFLNTDYNPTVISNWNTTNCLTEITNKLGYRFQLNSLVAPELGFPNQNMTITLRLNNLGFSSPFNRRRVFLILKNSNTNQNYPILMNTDPRFWVGTNEIIITETLTIPSTVLAGPHTLFLYLPDESVSLSTRPEYAIRFANQNIWNNTTGYNNLNSSILIAPLSVDENLNPIVSVYPNPANEELFIDLKSISEFTISFYNSIGSKLNVDLTITNDSGRIDTKNVSNGVYFLTFKKEGVSVTKKIIIKH